MFGLKKRFKDSLPTENDPEPPISRSPLSVWAVDVEKEIRSRSELDKTSVFSAFMS